MSNDPLKISVAPCGCTSFHEETFYHIRSWEKGCEYHGGSLDFNPSGIPLDIFNSDIAELQREIRRLQKKQKRKQELYLTGGLSAEDVRSAPFVILNSYVAQLQKRIENVQKKLQRKLQYREAIVQLSKSQT